MHAWLLLGIAIAFEIAATTLLKMSNGFRQPLYAAASMLLYSVCFWLLAFAFTRIPMGVAYAIWSGVGIAVIAILGVFFFRQPLSLVQVGCIALIMIGAIGLNLTTKQDGPDTKEQG